MSQTTPGYPDAVRRAAHEGAFGTWIWSGRVNSERESELIFPGAALLVGSVVGAGLLLALLEPSPTAKVAICGFALLFGLIGLAMAVTGMTYRKSGPWLLHQFQHGFVMQRGDRAPLALRNDAVRAELFAYTMNGDATAVAVEVGYVLLRVTPHGGDLIAMTEPSGPTADALVSLGRRCGAGAPVPIGNADAVVMLAEETWQLRGPVFSRASLLKQRR